MQKAAMKKLMQRILDETLEIYRDPDNISSIACECVYEDEDGNYCAVGRYLKPEARTQWTNRKYESILGKNKNCVINKISEPTIRAAFLPEVKDLPLEFWNLLQRVHDGRLCPADIKACQSWIDSFHTTRKKKAVKKKKPAKKSVKKKPKKKAGTNTLF